MRSASSASTRSPVSVSSNALDSPTSWRRMNVPPIVPITPRRTKYQPKLGALGGEADVAVQGDVHAVADRGPVDRRDGRLLQAEDDVERRLAVLDPVDLAVVLAGRAVLGEEDRLEVVAGAEAAALAGDEQAAHGVVGRARRRRLEDLARRLRSEGVHDLGRLKVSVATPSSAIS